MTRDDSQAANGNGNARLYALVAVLALGGGASGSALFGRPDPFTGTEGRAMEQRVTAAQVEAMDRVRRERAADLVALREELGREREIARRELAATLAEKLPPSLDARLGAIERWIVRTEPTWGAHLNDPSVAQRWRAAAGRPRDSP